MNVLITGGFGCIGSWLSRELVRQNIRVYIYDLREDRRRMRLIMEESEYFQPQFVSGDITDGQRLFEVCQQYAITHIVHLAALQVPVCRADPIRGATVNVLGTLVIFETIRKLAGQIQNLVYASSAAVYGEPSAYDLDGDLDESLPLRPTTHYGAYKVCNELSARAYFLEHGIASVGLRPWTVYGVGRDFGMTSEPTKAILAAALGKPYRISYGGSQDFQFAQDVARAFVRCLAHPAQEAVVYNLRGTVADMATFHHLLTQVAPQAAELITYGERQLPIAYRLSDHRFQRDYGPLPVTPLAEGIRQTFERFRVLAQSGSVTEADLA
ncbi:MAG: NAD-dependent epimerase/dehydratase [Gemmatales bacterium]|nr:NAD-dependent epimerase/dehydratase [Gemmatales bacterium]